MQLLTDKDETVSAIVPGPETPPALLDSIRSPADLRTLSEEQLSELCGQVRSFIVQRVGSNGGHLGSNLGVVELTVALHRVFRSPDDVLLWDTGHQTYTHKVLTGRGASFDTLRLAGGLSGYPSRSESAHDWIENSHASTALSYAHGMAIARGRAEPKGGHIVAIVGDGSLTGGMGFEGLNNIGASGERVIVVINDNGRSYAPTVSRLFGSQDGQTGERLEQFLGSLGITYVGPVDGHDIKACEAALRQAAEHSGPVAVHALTVKGKGYAPSEKEPVRCLHDAPRFDPSTGPPPGWEQPIGYTAAFGHALDELARIDDRVIAITAAMGSPIGLDDFARHHRGRLIDVGIAEQHALGSAAGLALRGMRPIVALYSTFLNRAFDQLYLDVGMHRLPVVVVLDRSGITGPDGPSHHGVLDLAHALRVPGLTVFAPSTTEEVGFMLRTAVSLEGPALIRYPKGRAPSSSETDVGLRARKLRTGSDVCIAAVGRTAVDAAEAAELLAEEGIEATVWDVRVAKPLDEAMILDIARHRAVVTVEDGVRSGGVGAAIASALLKLGAENVHRLRMCGVPDAYIDHGDASDLSAVFGLDVAGLVGTVHGVCEATADV